MDCALDACGDVLEQQPQAQDEIEAPSGLDGGRKSTARNGCATLVGLAFGDFGSVVFVEEEDVDDDEGGADGDGGVGDVEGGPVVVAEPNLEEVRDRAVNDAVGYVAGCAAEQKREARSGEGAAAVARDKQPSERADYYGGAYDQQDAHSCGWRIG